MDTTPIAQASAWKLIFPVLILASILLGTVYSSLPANAGWTNEHMERPFNDNGHPRSWIRLTGNCDDLLYCEARYKIQYSYWGWRNSGNSDIIVTPNTNSWTGAKATCNKSPGTYRGRLDMRMVNTNSFSVSAFFRGNGGSLTIPAQVTFWIRTSSPYAKGLKC